MLEFIITKVSPLSMSLSFSTFSMKVVKTLSLSAVAVDNSKSMTGGGEDDFSAGVGVFLLLLPGDSGSAARKVLSSGCSELVLSMMKRSAGGGTASSSSPSSSRPMLMMLLMALDCSSLDTSLAKGLGPMLICWWRKEYIASGVGKRCCWLRRVVAGFGIAGEFPVKVDGTTLSRRRFGVQRPSPVAPVVLVAAVAAETGVAGTLNE